MFVALYPILVKIFKIVPSPDLPSYLPIDRKYKKHLNYHQEDAINKNPECREFYRLKSVVQRPATLALPGYLFNRWTLRPHPSVHQNL